MASTQAKIGRSMKKLTMAPGLLLSRRRRRLGDLMGALRHRRRWPVLLRLHLAARLRQLHAVDDEAVAGLESGSHDPLIANGQISLQGPKLNHIVFAHDQSGWVAFLIVADALLRR